MTHPHPSVRPEPVEGPAYCPDCCATGVLLYPWADDCPRSATTCAVTGCGSNDCEIPCPRCNGSGQLPPPTTRQEVTEWPSTP